MSSSGGAELRLVKVAIENFLIKSMFIIFILYKNNTSMFNSVMNKLFCQCINSLNCNIILY